MRKTKTIETNCKITTDINGLQGMTSLGRQTCEKIGEDAGAVIRIGRRKLYNVDKIREYMNARAGIN